MQLEKMKKGDVAWVSAFLVVENGSIELDIPVVRVECILDVPTHCSFYSLQNHRTLDRHFKRAKKFATKLLGSQHIHATEEEAITFYENGVKHSVARVEREIERLKIRAVELSEHKLKKDKTRKKSDITI